QRAERNAHARAVGQVLPLRVATRVMILEGRAAQPDLIVELPRAQDVVARESVVAEHPTRLADADLRAEADQGRALVAGNLVAQKARVLEGLAAAVYFGARQQPRLGR